MHMLFTNHLLVIMTGLLLSHTHMHTHSFTYTQSIWVCLSPIPALSPSSLLHKTYHLFSSLFSSLFSMFIYFLPKFYANKEISSTSLTRHSHALLFLTENEIFSPLTDAEIFLRRLEQHGTEVNSPARRIYTVYPTLLVRQADRWKGLCAVSISLYMCGYVKVFSELLHVLAYSMCLWLWGGAPWAVNIGQSREGRRLLCVWHGLSVCQTHYQ